MLHGEESAFEEFFERYATAIYRFVATRLGRDSEHAGELTQVTLIKAIAKLDTYRGEAGLFAWLCTFCRHEIAEFYERRQRRPREVGLEEQAPEVEEAMMSSAGEQGQDPESSLCRRELAERVHSVLSEIPPPYGDVLEWKYIDGLSAREIAGRLGSSVKAAESLLTRARVAFRERFADRPVSVGNLTRRR
jgi:RNA polymerase sigma-70 factor (ECF subfamily)